MGGVRGLSVACLLVAGLAACGASPGGGGGTPEVLAVTPSDGAVGVRADANLEVVFSTAMDKGSVEAAYVSFSPGLRPNEVSFEWNAAGNKLTVNPTANLTYADAPAEAASYSFVIGTGARDTAGRGLAAGKTVSFRTLRHFSVALSGQVGLDGYTSSREVAYSAGVSGGPVAHVGGRSDLVPSGGSATISTRAFFSFDLSGIPSIPAADVLSARLEVEQVLVYPETTAYADMSTATEKVVLEHVSYGDSLTIADFPTPALSLVNASFFSNATLERHDADVKAQVANDLAARATRGNRSQYRLRFGKDVPEGTYGFADFATAEDAAKGPKLNIEYLAP
jgi:hypothetical protein